MDLDKSIILQSVGDEGAIIPKKLQKALIAALKDDSGSLLLPFPLSQLHFEVAITYTFECVQFTPFCLVNRASIVANVLI